MPIIFIHPISEARNWENSPTELESSPLSVSSELEYYISDSDSDFYDPEENGYYSDFDNTHIPHTFSDL